jgi:hypothetical protein
MLFSHTNQGISIMMKLGLKCSPDMEKLAQESFKAQQKKILSDGFRKIGGSHSM